MRFSDMPQCLRVRVYALQWRATTPTRRSLGASVTRHNASTSESMRFSDAPQRLRVRVYALQWRAHVFLRADHLVARLLPTRLLVVVDARVLLGQAVGRAEHVVCQQTRRTARCKWVRTGASQHSTSGRIVRNYPQLVNGVYASFVKPSNYNVRSDLAMTYNIIQQM